MPLAQRAQLMNGENQMARAKRISKATGYLNRIYTVEYDLDGMIKAYGVQFVLWLAGEISKGRIDTRQVVDRWSAHVHLAKNFDFASELDAHPHRYEDPASCVDLDAA